MIEAFFFNYNKIFVFLKLLHNTGKIRNILVDLTVDQCHQKRLPYFLDTFHDLFIVININQSGHQPLLFIRPDIPVQLCHILKMYRNKIFLFLRYLQKLLCLTETFDRYALDLSLIISVKIIEFQAYRFILFLWKYAPVQLRNIFTQIGILPDSRPKDFPELCVRPDDFSIIQ